MDMRFPRELSVFAIVLLCGLAACTSNQDPQALKEKTAQATAELKGDAKAVAAGGREGLEPRQAAQCKHRDPRAIDELAGRDRCGGGRSDCRASLRRSEPTRHSSHPADEQVRQ